MQLNGSLILFIKKEERLSYGLVWRIFFRKYLNKLIKYTGERIDPTKNERDESGAKIIPL
jgi:hypothetical protein